LNSGFAGCHVIRVAGMNAIPIPLWRLNHHAIWPYLTDNADDISAQFESRSEPTVAVVKKVNVAYAQCLSCCALFGLTDARHFFARNCGVFATLIAIRANAVRNFDSQIGPRRDSAAAAKIHIVWMCSYDENSLDLSVCDRWHRCSPWLNLW
jgi:hypothetical protein